MNRTRSFPRLHNEQIFRIHGNQKVARELGVVYFFNFLKI